MRRNNIVVCALALLAPTLLLASPSGLNNIPTADYAPAGTLVLQAYGTLAGGDGDNSLFFGAKFGVGNGLEVGVDRLMAPSPEGPIAFQAKKTWGYGPLPVRLCVGVANITDDTADHPLYPYGVASIDLPGRSHGHLGFAPQRGNHDFFLGYDYTLTNGTTLRADLVRGLTNRNEYTLYGLGALVPKPFGAVEGWVSRNVGSSPGVAGFTSVTLKVDYALKVF